MTHLVEVAPGVLVGTSRFMVTNTVVVTAGRRALVVDPGVHLDELEAVARELLVRRLDVVGGFATHAHWDHVLWHRDLGDAPRWASRGTVVDAATHQVDLLDQAEAVTPVDGDRLAVLVPAEAALPWDGPEARLVVHDGHARGHAALHLPELGLLVAGDMGSDVEVPLLDHGRPGPDALAAHLEGLDRLAALDRVDVVVTGHGHVCDGPMFRRRLDADRRYLDELARGLERDDVRLCEPWLVDADAAMGAALDKAAWRRWVRERRDPTSAQAGAVQEALAGFLTERFGHRDGAPTVAAYDALPGEVDLADLLAPVDAPDPRTGVAARTRVPAAAVALPRIDGDAVTWHLDVGRLEPHRLGVRQPPADAPEVPEPTGLDVVLVPGRCFDRHGIRLGRGGGHYDRLLPRLAPGTPVVGVTTRDRVVDRLPTEAHDRPMTHLATEDGVVAVG